MLSFKTIDKDFGATRAVINVTLDAEPGAVLGLVGENGAGKSTLIKIAGGIVRQDRGVVSLDGEAMVGLGPAKAIARGIVSVFQELTLVRSLTVAENLFLSAPPRRAWASIDRRKLEADAQALLDGYDVGASATAVVATCRSASSRWWRSSAPCGASPRVLLLDEATAALGATEVEWLMRIVEAERKRGSIILFISHRWEEITAFCQRVAVMRNGELVTLADVDDISHDRAVELMTGARLGGVFPTDAIAGPLCPSRSARPSERCAARRRPAARQGRNPRHRRSCRTGTGRAAQIAVRRPSAARRRDLRRGQAGATQEPP